MKARIIIDGRTYALRDLDEHALVIGLDVCPRCNRREAVCVRGTGKRIESRDTYVSDAIAMCCRKPIGTIRVLVSTIFGLEEDENLYAMVTRLGGKVY